jgi:putative protein-disulfide isomerase
VYRRAVQARLIYAFDPLCGWCFGFRPTIRALRSAIGERASWGIACAGLVTGDRERPIRELRDSLEKGMMQVERRSGARFGQEFRSKVLASGAWTLRSEPGCRALFVAEQIAGEGVFEFAEALITAFYEDGSLPDEPSVLRAAAEETGIDAAALLAAWSAPDAARSTHAMFAMWRARGVSVYPAVFVERGDKLERIFEGYVETDVAIDRVEAVL